MATNFDPEQFGAAMLSDLDAKFDELERNLFGEVQPESEPEVEDEEPLDPEAVFDIEAVLQDYSSGKLDGEALQAIADHESRRRSSTPRERTVGELRQEWDQAAQERLLASPEFAAWTESKKGL